MAKFSVLKNAVIPTKRTGAKKNLLARGFIVVFRLRTATEGELPHQH